MNEETGSARTGDRVDPGLDADAEDEALAAAARAHYRTDGITSIEPDHGMRSSFRSDEHLLALRQTASIRRLPNDRSPPMSGRLVITTERLMMVDKVPVTLASLDELDDVTLVADRLLVMLTSVVGFTIETWHPRLLRVQLAAARASRFDHQAGASSKAAPELPSDLPLR